MFTGKNCYWKVFSLRKAVKGVIYFVFIHAKDKYLIFTFCASSLLHTYCYSGINLVVVINVTASFSIGSNPRTLYFFRKHRIYNGYICLYSVLFNLVNFKTLLTF